MAKSLKDFEIVDENGKAVEENDLEEFLDDHDFVQFTVTKRNGQTRTFTIEVDNSKVTNEDVGRYRKAMAKMAVEADEADERNLDKPYTEAQEAKEVLDALDVNDQMAQHQAELLSKLVVDSNYPNKDFSKVEVLIDISGTGAGPAALKALNSYFFGVSKEPEEEIGTTETASTQTPSDSSEAMDNSEVTPPTS